MARFRESEIRATQVALGINNLGGPQSRAMTGVKASHNFDQLHHFGNSPSLPAIMRSTMRLGNVLTIQF